MQTFLIIDLLVIILSNSAMDAIDHMKGSETLYELWHILKAVCILCYLIPMYILADTTLWNTCGVLLMSWGTWEVSYNIFRHINLKQYDNKVSIPLLRVIWGINRKDK